MKSRVFVSYSHGDLGEVKRLAWDLRVRGVDTWVDFENLRYGEDWKKAVTGAIRTCDAFLVCVSRKMLRTGYVNAEIQDALEAARSHPDGQIFVVPVLLDNLGRGQLPWGLGKYHCERLPRSGMPRENALRRLVVSLGYPRPDAFGHRAEADYRELCARYFSHVNWWLFGRSIEPNGQFRGASSATFGDALAEHYMVRTARRAFPICGPTSRAFPVMQRLQGMLYPNPQTMRGRALPIVAVLEDPRRLDSKFLGLVTPTDLLSKWEHWYVNRETIAPHVWFENPRVASKGSTVRSAYRTMGTILTGIPIVDVRTKALAGVLAHPGTREDWSPPVPRARRKRRAPKKKP